MGNGSKKSPSERGGTKGEEIKRKKIK